MTLLPSAEVGDTSTREYSPIFDVRKEPIVPVHVGGHPESPIFSVAAVVAVVATEVACVVDSAAGARAP